MKKALIGIGIFLFSIQLMAGGNIDPYLSETAKIPKKICNAKKVYIEKDANLMWQDQAYVDAEDGAFKRNYSVAKVGTWKHAVNYCRGLNYAGYSDWRLPTSDELIRVHRKEGQVFSYYRDNDFWTSTPSADVRYNVVYPADAYPYKRYKRESNYIRCVRCMGDETPQKRYLLSDDPEYTTR